MSCPSFISLMIRVQLLSSQSDLLQVVPGPHNAVAAVEPLLGQHIVLLASCHGTSQPYDGNKSYSTAQNSGYMIGQIADLGQKLEKAETQVSHASRSTSFADKPQEETQLSKCARDGFVLSVAHHCSHLRVGRRFQLSRHSVSCLKSSRRSSSIKHRANERVNPF